MQNKETYYDSRTIIWDRELLFRQETQPTVFETNGALADAPLDLRNWKRVWRALHDSVTPQPEISEQGKNSAGGQSDYGTLGEQGSNSGNAPVKCYASPTNCFQFPTKCFMSFRR